MERDYTQEYESLLKTTIFGTRVRAFFLGYNSERVGNYLDKQKQLLWAVEDEAYNKRVEIRNRTNENLSFTSFDLECRLIEAKLNLA